MIRSLTRLATIAVLAAATASCALSLRNPDIADLQRHPARYQDRTVCISGVETSSWGVPLVPFRLYKVDDGTGEVTILSQGLLRRHWRQARLDGPQPDPSIRESTTVLACGILSVSLYATRPLAATPGEGRYLALRGLLETRVAGLEPDPGRKSAGARVAVASLEAALAANPLLAREYGPVLAEARLAAGLHGPPPARLL